jgi:hypothetical protein
LKPHKVPSRASLADHSETVAALLLPAYIPILDSMAGVTIEHRSGLGNVLVATRGFQPREAVVHERPLLHVPQLKPSNPLYKPLQVTVSLNYHGLHFAVDVGQQTEHRWLHEWPAKDSAPAAAAPLLLLSLPWPTL